MKSVWVIEQGSYSDYHVAGVFSSKKNAELILSKMTGTYETPSIAQWDLDPAVEEINAGLMTWNVRMLRDGTVEHCEEYGMTSYGLASDLSLWRRSQAPAYRGKGIEDCLSGTVWAKDGEHAIKIANERRAQMIAENKWKEPA